MAVIQRYRRRFQRFVDGQAGQSARAQLEAYFQLSTHYYQHNQQICPSGVLSAEFHAAVRHAGRSPGLCRRNARLGHPHSATRPGQRGFHFAGDARAMAAVMFAALQGGLQLARLDAAILDDLKRQLCALLGLPPC